MNLADMLRNSPLRRQRNEGQGEYDRPESYYRNQGIDGQPLPSISDRLQSMGMDSSIKDRPMLIPVREDGEWTAPEWFHSMARGAMLPAQAALGGTVTPLDTAMATADFAGGGLLSSKAIPNAVPDGAVLGATAWQGSPHKFDKFDMSKIGTGEGAQAYGHGLYAAENPNVAKEYRDKLASGQLHQPDGSVFDPREKLKNLNVRATLEKTDGNIEKTIDRANELIKSLGAGTQGAEYAKKDIEVLSQLKGLARPQGYLYKMDIPDDQIAKMMDWDKPLSEQSKYVREILKKEGYDRERLYDKTPNTWGSDVYKNMMNNLDQRKGLGKRGSSMATAEELKRIGIPGIKYLDQGSRTGGKGTSNFVLFADDIAKILERNDQPIGDLAKGLLE